jgi:hypothetical protein
MTDAVRVVLAVLLTGALLGAGVPAADRAQETRTADRLDETATGLADVVARLSARNDPTPGGAARRTLVVSVPPGGSLRIDPMAIRWRVGGGQWHARRVPERLGVGRETLRLPSGRHRLHLSLQIERGRPVVRVARVSGD